jgi:hypothetical protein
LLASVYLTHCWAVGCFPYQLDYGEPVVLLMAKLTAQGAPIYQDFQQPPFWTFPYVPMFAWILSIYPSFQAGRLLGCACLLSILALTAFAYRRQPNANWPIFAALLLANPVILRWTTLCRVDSLALLFAGSGLLCAHLWQADPATSEDSPKSRSVLTDIILAALFACSFFSKQSFIAAPLAVGAFFLRQDLKRGSRYCLIQALMIGLGLLSLREVYGPPIFKALFANNAVPWQSAQALDYCSHYLWVSAPLIILAILVARPSLFLTYTFCSLLSVVGSGRAGADYNYFLEFHLALCLLVSTRSISEHDSDCLLARLNLANGRNLCMGLFLVQIVVAGGLVQLSDTFYSYAQHFQYECLPIWSGGSPKYITRSQEVGQQMELSLRKIKGPIVAENFGCVLNADAELWMCDPISLSLLGQNGQWNERALLDELTKHRVAAVVLQRLDDNPRFSQAFLDTVKAHYKPSQQIGKETIFLPSDKAATP